MMIATAGVAVAYLVKKKLPESMSAMVYDLPTKWQWVWSMWVWAIAILLSKGLIEAMPHVWWAGLTGFATIACLACVGAVPLMPMEVEVGEHPRWWKRRRAIHYILAMTGGVLSQVCVLLINPWWLMVWVWWIPLSFCTIFFDDKPWWKQIEGVIEGKGMMLVELTAMVTLYGCMLFS